MILRLYLFTIYLILFLSAGLLLLILFNVNPFDSPFWMLCVFYLSFLLFWTSLFSIIGYYLKVWASNRELIFIHLIPTLRQSILVGSAFTSLLFLQQIKALNWWIVLIITLAFIMMELFFRAKTPQLKN